MREKGYSLILSVTLTLILLSKETLDENSQRKLCES